MEKCLERLGNSYQGCEEEISELIYQINKLLNDKKNEWELSYSKLLESHEDLSQSVSEYKIEIADKNAEISDLRKELTNVDKSNYGKRLALEERISDLNHALSTSQEKSRLYNSRSCTPNSQDTLELTISALKKECDYYQDKIAGLEVVNTTNTTQIKLLEEQRVNILKKTEELKQKFSTCRKEYHNKLNATNVELDNLVKQQNDSEQTIIDLRTSIKEKDEEIRQFKGTLEDVLTSNQKNNTMFSNMKNSYEALKNENDGYLNHINSLKAENSKLQQDDSCLKLKLEMMEKETENTAAKAQSEVSMIRAQLDIHLKENDFLRTYLLQQEKLHPGQNNQFQFLEKLEADNLSLKENILNMEGELSNLIKLTEQKSFGTLQENTSFTSKIKEYYEQHLTELKSEMEEIKLENLSLKAVHEHCDHSNISCFSSIHQSPGVSLVSISQADDKVKETIEKPPMSPSFAPSEYSLSLTPQPKKTDISPVTPKNEKVAEFSPLTISSFKDRCKESDSVSLSSSLTKDFEHLQKNVLRQFEQKLNECIDNFNPNKSSSDDH